MKHTYFLGQFLRVSVLSLSLFLQSCFTESKAPLEPNNPDGKQNSSHLPVHNDHATVEEDSLVQQLQEKTFTTYDGYLVRFERVNGKWVASIENKEVFLGVNSFQVPVHIASNMQITRLLKLIKGTELKHICLNFSSTDSIVPISVDVTKTITQESLEYCDFSQKAMVWTNKKQWTCPTLQHSRSGPVRCLDANRILMERSNSVRELEKKVLTGEISQEQLEAIQQQQREEWRMRRNHYEILEEQEIQERKETWKKEVEKRMQEEQRKIEEMREQEEKIWAEKAMQRKLRMQQMEREWEAEQQRLQKEFQQEEDRKQEEKRKQEEALANEAALRLKQLENEGAKKKLQEMRLMLDLGQGEDIEALKKKMEEAMDNQELLDEMTLLLSTRLEITEESIMKEIDRDIEKMVSELDEINSDE
jgi:hypothetical protein